MSKIIVIGANHAGTAAINTILANGKENEVVVFDANSNISFLGCGMALWIGNQIKGAEGLFYSNKELLEDAGAKVNMESKVDKIDFDNKKVFVTLKDGEKKLESYDKLILATGSLPIIPNVPGKDLENVQLVKLYQNAEDVIEKLKNPELNNIIVIGAGYIGVELAEAFKRHDKNVTMIDVASTCLSNYYDLPFSSEMDKNLKEHGINLSYGERLIEIKGDKKVKTVVTDKNEYPADLVVLCIGFRPNNELGKDKLELFRNGAYLVNRNQETSQKNVYAIGDCATVYDNSIDSIGYIALASNAVRSGIIAAYNAIDIPLESIGVQGSNGICIFDFMMVSTGISMQRAKNLGLDVDCVDYEDYQKPEFIETSNEKVKIRIVFDKKTRVILGVQMASKYDMHMGNHMFSLAIQEKVTIDKLKLLDIFFLPHFNKPYNYITMAALSAK
ncbi:MAG: FAD-dependent oxidoreductase [Oscillospiraceae bacterium]|nr:FAD-dependent oxidoreductase [Oscillospiraceae bacterium]